MDPGSRDPHADLRTGLRPGVLVVVTRADQYPIAGVCGIDRRLDRLVLALDATEASHLKHAGRRAGGSDADARQCRNREARTSKLLDTIRKLASSLLPPARPPLDATPRLAILKTSLSTDNGGTSELAGLMAAGQVCERKRGNTRFELRVQSKLPRSSDERTSGRTVTRRSGTADPAAPRWPCTVRTLQGLSAWRRRTMLRRTRPGEMRCRPPKRLRPAQT
jgi:hypothetical protein